MKKILVIEDNTDLRENTVELLELNDYEVLEAKNGELGIALAITHLPDLVICDILMPEKDGFEVLSFLQHHAETEKIPFVFLSAKSEPRDVQNGLAGGAMRYLIKPFEIQPFLDAVKVCLQSAV